ncbi:MAG: hypothetical protein NPIRA05_17820 [Nitrospirales bacterium]|nr:MAG: hypothetical protein NPIRA05_17820 [Nitrospirales bacterium]
MTKGKFANVFKEEAVEEVIERGCTVSDVAKRFEKGTFSFSGDVSRAHSTKRQSRFAIWLTDAETANGEVIEP